MLFSRAVGALCGVLVVAGCSDSNDVGADAGGPQFGTSGVGGFGAASGASGAGGSAGINSQTGGTGGGGSGGMSGQDGGMMMQLQCDTSVPTTATCGGTACPEPGGFAAMICVVPCCVNDACGTRNTSMQLASDCALPPEPDERCPGVMIGGMMVDGCCTNDNRCGIADGFLTNSCVAREDVPPQIADLEPLNCDEAAADAGL